VANATRNGSGSGSVPWQRHDNEPATPAAPQSCLLAGAGRHHRSVDQPASMPLSLVALEETR
jgi:hypothetical protein